ncbi:MAG TPA: nickel pincer cofactor biosynthesis protein LarB [Chthoniobacterales bacterium]
MPVNEHINLDFKRAARLGFNEAIYAESKSVAQLAHILEQAVERGESFLLTRLRPDQHAALPPDLRQGIDFDPVSRTGYFGGRPTPQGAPRVAIVSAGTSDAPVVAEAARTLRFYGEGNASINDVGVAGIWRLLERVEELVSMPVVIVVAGMDGALPSVVGGLVPGLVIAVPTSVGYGVANGGSAALHACLASCAPGLVVMNVDNGYGAACAALRALRGRGPATTERQTQG